MQEKMKDIKRELIEKGKKKGSLSVYKGPFSVVVAGFNPR